MGLGTWRFLRVDTDSKFPRSSSLDTVVLPETYHTQGKLSQNRVRNGPMPYSRLSGNDPTGGRCAHGGMIDEENRAIVAAMIATTKIQEIECSDGDMPERSCVSRGRRGEETSLQR
jgi:hypothetical protein